MKLSNYNVSIIIVSWNTKNLLKNCLQSIFRNVTNVNFETIVVDNASTDGSVDMVKKEFPRVSLIENTENLGFAKANNQAFKLIRNSKYILFLNSDTVLLNASLQEMLEFMERNQTVGAVGPALRLPDGKCQTGGAGFHPSLFTAFNYYFLLSIFFPKIFKGLFISGKNFLRHRIPVEVDWVSGACMLVRNKAIKEAGSFNESYFMYIEDIEWCERIRKNDWKIFYLPYLEIIHYHGGSSRGISADWLKVLMKYVNLKYGTGQTVLFRFIVAFGLWIRFLIFSLLFIVTGGKSKFQKKSYQMLVYSLKALFK